ncbi:hypothetical protein [Streptomyces sp. NPDC059994]|uniref:hypothetical protein n=1 Tax=Streptomyces sp. NPDC059994 TaxID=3347029 RepID=UPI00367645E3
MTRTAVVCFQLPGAGTAVPVADPVVLEATAHMDKRPEELFAFLDPLCEAGNLQVLPADEHTPWRRLPRGLRLPALALLFVLICGFVALGAALA